MPFGKHKGSAIKDLPNDYKKWLFENFESLSAKAWKQKIQFELAGADYNQTLLTKTIEGITISPFYHLDTFEKLIVPLPKEDSKIGTKITSAS